MVTATTKFSLDFAIFVHQKNSLVYEVFKSYLDSKIRLTQAQHDWIYSNSVLKKLRKKQYLSQKGDVWTNNAFVSKGLLRTYAVDEKGIEHVISFAMENWWAGDREALMSGKPSRFNIDAIEDSEIVLIEKLKFETICKEIPAFNDMVNNIIQRSFITSQNRIHEAISSSIEEKYENFVRRYPAIASRVPQSMIASYLGITRETLSRVRHKTAKNPAFH
jgi:CRP-like cAMP-binding protein